MMKYRITILPKNRHFFVDKDQNVLEVLVNSGNLLRSDCGGNGRCGKCLVRIVTSPESLTPPPDDKETRVLGLSNLGSGYRLACQVSVCEDLSVEIPETSLFLPEVSKKGPLLLLDKAISDNVSAVSRQTYGLAIDLGTTTIGIYLCDLHEGVVVSTLSIKNPQAIFGEDVMSRIGVASRTPSGCSRLQRITIKAIEWGILAVCRSQALVPEKISCCVVVGNSTMIHLFSGENPASIGTYPYRPLFTEDRVYKAGALGFTFNPDAEIYTLPLVSGFLGSDIVAAVLSTEIRDKPVGTVLVDVGTNGEVVLVGENGLVATSCATGPAFEGATISHGMQAVSGAIDGIKIDSVSGVAVCSVLQKTEGTTNKPTGICGTGVINAVAELYRSGGLTKTGRYNPDKNWPTLQRDETGMLAFILVSPDDTEANRAITISQKDIRSVQLAKGALLAGIHLLCRHSKQIQPKQLLVAGAFGSYIDKHNARTIGMFPDLSPEHIQVVGNAAGVGAILCLLNPSLRLKAQDLARSIRVLDLASLPDFQSEFMAALPFPDPIRF